MRARRLALATGRGGARELASEIRGLAAVPLDVGAAVREILAAVRERGDEAVLELTRRFDSAAAGDDLRVPPEALRWALARLDPAVRRGLEGVHLVRHS